MQMPEWLGWVLGLALWVIFWLGTVNWRKAWPILAHGGWAPVLLLALMSAMVWSRLDTRSWDRLSFVVIPPFWWQLIGVAILVALALICGWLQVFLGWTPPEIAVEPPPADHGHHAHDLHGHVEHH
jgi:hypothetical protein